MAKTKTARAKQSAQQLVEVTLRRLAKPAGAGKVGEFVLIVNPKLYGSTGANWLGGKSYPTRDEAAAAAANLGGRIAS